MIRTFTTLTLLAALAGPAAAQDVTIHLAGKDPRTISAEIDKAAWSVCTQAYRKGDIDFFEISSCACDASDTAQTKAFDILAASRASDMSALARNDVAPTRQ